MQLDKLKELGVNIHVIATGAGAGLQKCLWEVPGSSAYLSGCSFPYDDSEQEELLGFMPEHCCSPEAAVDLASAAYMKAYKFGGKRAVGLGLTASVASVEIHRGEHRVFICVMTDDKVLSGHLTLQKGVGVKKRKLDGDLCDVFAAYILGKALGVDVLDLPFAIKHDLHDATQMALDRFWLRPCFMSWGLRGTKPLGRFAIMPGAFNPPHEGHFGMARASQDEYNYPAVFETTAEPPHKAVLTVQEMLQRAKMLQGHDRLFTRKLPHYLDKARAYPGTHLILGADAMVRMLDPKWDLDPIEMFKEFINLNTKLFVGGREIDGKFTTCEDILKDLRLRGRLGVWSLATNVLMPLDGRWNISSTQLRKQFNTRL